MGVQNGEALSKAGWEREGDWKSIFTEPSRMEKMKLDEKGNVEWFSRQSVQHEGDMETGKQGTLELFNLAGPGDS